MFDAVCCARLKSKTDSSSNTDTEVMQNTYATFEKHIDLKEAYCDWNRRIATTWEDMKTYFSKEIQINKTNPAIMQRTASNMERL